MSMPKGVSQHALRQTPPAKPMATAVGGTHPTGMHSCVSFDLCFFYNIEDKSNIFRGS